MILKLRRKKLEPGQKRNTIQEDNIRQFLHLVIEIQEDNQPYRKQKLCA